MPAPQNIEEIREEIVQVLSKHLPQEQVHELRQLLAHYFAQKATEEFDRLADENNWTNETYEAWLKERLRRPYQ